MRLVIFGAGASFGSQASAPPVTASLLRSLQLEFPSSWGSLEQDLIAKARGDFELIMERLLDARIGSFGWTLQRDLALYFLRYDPSPDSLYRRFACDLVGSALAICTLNYDLLLQRAMLEEDRRIWVAGFEEPVSGATMLLLPHGSAGLCETSNTIQGNVAHGTSPFNAIAVPRVRGGLYVTAHELSSAFARNQLNPIMSYIEPEKRSIMGSENLANAREQLKGACDQADRIAIIGMRYQQHDKHIVDALKAARGKIMVCCAGNGSDYRSNLGTRVIDLNLRWDAGYEEVRRFLLA